MSEPFDLDAKLANRVSITMNEEGMRVCFGEALPKLRPDDAAEVEKVRYHSVVFLPGAVGLGLRDLLTEVLVEHDRLTRAKPN